MNYRNAQDIFPENLLKQIQRYVSGEKKDFAEGLTIEQLSEKYCLSFDSVKHIVYTKQERADEISGDKNIFFVSAGMNPPNFYNLVNLSENIGRTFFIGMTCSDEEIVIEDFIKSL